MYQRFWKEVNGDKNYLRCPYLRDDKFEVLGSEITQDKIDLENSENVRAKTNGNESVFITYSNTISFYSKRLYNSRYIITQ